MLAGLGLMGRYSGLHWIGMGWIALGWDEVHNIGLECTGFGR